MIQKQMLHKAMSRFPSFKLCYEKVAHNKVSSDIYLTIPFGKKFFAWFTYVEKQCICIFLQIASKVTKEIEDISVFPVCFDESLSIGTVLYGTMFMNNKQKFFNVEDVHYYKGKFTSMYTMGDKLNILNLLFKNDIKQISYSQNYVVFGLPNMSTNYEELVKRGHFLNYNLYAIQGRSLHKLSHYLNVRYNNKVSANYKSLPSTKQAVFIVRPNLQNDIYELFYKESSKLVFHGIALINNYTTSVAMNKLYRNIRENDDLDALEESEDEEEFENIDIDKFVDMSKEFTIKCTYYPKFKKWAPNPNQIVEDKSLVSTKEEIHSIEQHM